MAKITRYPLMIYTVFMGWLLAFSACTVKPLHEGFDVSGKFPKKYAFDNFSISKTHLSWQDSFPSQNLQNDVSILLENNFELEAALARVEQAVAVYGLAEASLIPSLDVNADFDRSKIREDGDENNNSTGNTISFEGIVHWEMDIWGRLKAKKKAAALSIEEKKALADQATLDLQALLVETWVTYHAARRLEQVLKEQQKTNAQFLDLTEIYFTQGQGSALDILQQRGRLLATEKALPSIISRKRRAANAYAVLIGRLPDGCDLADDVLPSIELLSGISSPQDLFVNRPDLRASFLALKTADQNVAAAVAERLPQLSVGLSYGKSRESFSTLETETVFSFTSGLIAPVFDAGRLKAKVNQIKTEASELLSVLEQAVLVAVREVEDALEQELSLFDERKFLQKEISIAHETVNIARLRYVNGKGSYLTVLSSLEDLQILQVEEIELQQELLINRCRLLKALGVKWSH